MNKETQEWFDEHSNMRVSLRGDSWSPEVSIEEMYRMFRDRMVSEIRAVSIEGSLYVSPTVLAKERLCE